MNLFVPVAPADLSLLLDRAKAYASAANHEAACSLSKVDLRADIKAPARIGDSEDTARQQGCRLLTDVNIDAAIAEAMAARSKRVWISEHNALRRLLPSEQGRNSERGA